MNIIFKDKFLLFTDASVDGKVDTRNGNIVVGGVVIVHQSPDSIVDVKLFPFKHCTNNYGEMYSIYAAMRICKELNMKYGENSFTIFSDSQYSVYSLRDWIYGWYRNVNNGNESILTSSGNELKNRELIDSIIMNAVYSQGLRIKLIHVNGHTDEIKKNYVSTFIRSNFPSNFNVSTEYYNKLKTELKRLLNYNVSVDMMTREYIQTAKSNYNSLANPSLGMRLAFPPYNGSLSLYNNVVLSRAEILGDLL